MSGKRSKSRRAPKPRRSVYCEACPLYRMRNEVSKKDIKRYKGGFIRLCKILKREEECSKQKHIEGDSRMVLEGI